MLRSANLKARTFYHNQTPLVAHVIRRLAMGGLENGLINLINHMPSHRFRHAIICLTHSTDYSCKIQRKDVEIIELHQKNGHDLGVHHRFSKVIRALQPHIIHTRNLPALEFQIVAALSGVRGRIHGEHGRDVYDLDGKNMKYNFLRRTIRPVIHRYIAVSQDLAGWLVKTVRVQPRRVDQIYNGVDTVRFHPRIGQRFFPGPQDFVSAETFVLGTVGRMEPVKDQLTLVRAFLHLLEIEPGAREHVRLVMVGDGQLKDEAGRLVQQANAERFAWIPGERSDIAEIMRSLDLFVLPSMREGISNTILEAMATGLPVVATDAGGNSELVDDGKTGILIPPSDPIAMAQAIHTYVLDRCKLLRHGQAGRKKVEARFSIQSMVAQYMTTYDSVLMNTRLIRQASGMARTLI